jgi:hypothetical protein
MDIWIVARNIIFDMVMVGVLCSTVFNPGFNSASRSTDHQQLALANTVAGDVVRHRRGEYRQVSSPK